MDDFNPHLEELKYRPALISNYSGVVSLLVPWLLPASCFVLIALLSNYQMGRQLWLLFMGVSIALTVLVPFIGASTAATMTASDIETGHYTLVALTNVTDRDLIHSYFYAALYRIRGALWLMAFAMVTAALGSIWIQMRESPTTDATPLALTWLFVGVQLPGLCLAVVSLGVTVSLWVRGAGLPGIAMPLLALVLSLGGQFLLARALLLPTPGERDSWFYWWQFPILILLPYLITGGNLWLAKRHARRLFQN